MYRHFIPIFLCLMCHGLAAHGAVDVANDSTMTDITLGEVVVKAPKVINKADMDVYIPSKGALNASADGISLLNRMMIPALNVNELMGTVRTGGQDVEIRINGRKASPGQLKAILPSTVKRIEWIDNPGLRYGDVPAVVNVIVTNPTVGGSLMSNVAQAFNQPWGNGSFDLKLNNGRSQWAVGGWGHWTNRMSSYREYSETFTRPDGVSVTRTESPVDGDVSMSHINPEVSYNYVNPDKTVVWVGLSMHKEGPTERNNIGLMSLTGSDSRLLLHESESTSSLRPKFNAYLEQRFPHSQTLAVNFNASLFNGRSTHDYVETPEGASEPQTDVHTLIRDRNRSINVEADYIKQWERSKLTAGVKYTANRNRSTRESGRISRQRQDHSYFFAEYFQRIGRFSLTAGAGAQYTDLKTLETGRGSSSWSMRPRLSLSYKAAASSQFRLNFTVRQSSPSLSQMSETPQQIDGFQYQIGNPSLKNYSTYRLSLQYNFNFPRVNGKVEARTIRAPHEVTPYMWWDGDRLLTSFENSHGQTSWQLSVSPQIEIIPQYLTLKGTLRYYRCKSAGTGYRHTYGAWSGDVSLLANYRSFNLLANYDSATPTLWGETITKGESTSMLAVGYRYKGLMVMVGMFMPFSRYSMSSESLNRYNTNKNVLRSQSFDKMPCIQINYNFNWGHQKKSAKRLLDSDSDTDSSRSKAAAR